MSGAQRFTEAVRLNRAVECWTIRRTDTKTPQIRQAYRANFENRQFGTIAKKVKPVIFRHAFYFIDTKRILGTSSVTISEFKLKTALISSRAFLDNSHDGIVCINANSSIVYVNSTLLRIFGYDDAEEVLLHPLEVLMNDADRSTHRAYIDRHLERETIPSMNRLRRLRAKRKDGSEFPADIQIFSYEESGERYYAGFIRDQSEVEKKEQMLKSLVFIDQLTGLGNVRSLEKALDTYFSQKIIDRLMIVALGIDHMRSINTSYGFEVGDKVIEDIGSRLTTGFPLARFIGRLHGDQFVILLDAPQDEPSLATVTEQIHQTFDAPIELETVKISVSATIGTLRLPELASTSDMAIKLADLALMDAKTAGKGRVIELTRDRIADLELRASLTEKMRKALDDQEFSIVVQPKLNVASGKCTGGEVLVRWKQPDGTMIPPDYFIPAAEDSGLIEGIGQFVLEKACQLIADLGNTGAATDLKLAVNVSPKQLEQDGFLQSVETTTSKHGILPSNIELEVTETAVAGSSGKVRNTLLALWKQGIKIALDDFGKGQSSLTMLRHIELDRVKLDRGFVLELSNSEHNFTLLQSTIAMLRAMSYQVSVEGVEEREIHDLLFALHVDEVQGYYYAKPLVVEEFRAFLSQNLHPQPKSATG